MITAVEPWSGHYPVDDSHMAVVRIHSCMFIAVRLCMFIAVRLPT